MASESSHLEERAAKRQETSDSWKQNEEHAQVPKNRLGVVGFALVCTAFIATMDLTIVATALPSIVADLHGASHYNWVASSYMLTAGTFGSLYGRLSDMFGRKPLLYSCNILFMIGSGLCGAAQNMTWLIICRALQGIGGGGVIQLSILTISDIVPSQDRGQYIGLFGAMYGVASVAGPLLGGVLTQYASWRWCFFINLPIGVIATALLFFLEVHPPQKRLLRDQINEIDFIGLFCLATGMVCLFVGLNFGAESWSEPQAIGLLIVGVILLVVGVVNEAFTTRATILPPRLFKTRTTGCLLAIAFLNNFVFFPTIFYLPLLYQVFGASAIRAGIKTLPYTLVSSTFSVTSGFIVSRMGKNLPIIWFGSTMMTVGIGLLTTLNYTSSLAEQEVFPLIAAFGYGILLQVPILALQAAMPLKDMAAATSSFLFLRTLGGTAGSSIGDAIITTVLPQKLAAIPNLDSLTLGNPASDILDSVEQLHLIPDIALRHAVLQACAESISTAWTVMTVIAGVATILTLVLRESLMQEKNKTLFGGIGCVNDSADAEKNTGSGSDGEAATGEDPELEVNELELG